MTLLPGGSYFDSALSFAIIRGRHRDISVLDAFQVSEAGDLANWSTGAADDIPALGGAMDLAVGAREIWVMMEHVSKHGEPRIVERCTHPLTAHGVGRRIFSNLALIDVFPGELVVQEILPGLSFDALLERTGARLMRGPLHPLVP